MTGVAAAGWNGFVRLATRRATLVAAALAVGLWAVLASAQEAATAPEVTDVRLGVDAEGQTRIVFDTDARPAYDVAVLEGGTLAVTIAGGRFARAGSEGAGAVERWSASAQTATLRLEGYALPVRSFVLSPTADVPHYRLVIDLGPVDAQAYAEAVTAEVGPSPAEEPAPRLAQIAGEDGVPAPSLKPAPPSAAAPAPAPRVAQAARPARGTKTVVIDPGHGGYDPGASGPNGMREEFATLAAAQALQTILQARGYEVILTREADAFVELEERVEIARRAHADLFLSLHADAHGDPRLRGASVYTLSDKRAGRMAQEIKGQGDFALYDVALSEEERDVGDILFDIASTDTLNASGRLAATLIDELSGRVPMINNTHRKASLRVLLSPDVPAVLVEMAFISNPEDEANLGSSRWRRRAMTAVADGIDAYFGAQVARAGGERGEGAAGG